jgi:hypothetical protein
LTGERHLILRDAKCILPSKFPHIGFDADGVCNYCEAFRPIKYKGESALKDLLDAYRGKRSNYDCIVPISEGKDRSFVLYKVEEVQNAQNGDSPDNAIRGCLS